MLNDLYPNLRLIPFYLLTYLICSFQAMIRVYIPLFQAFPGIAEFSISVELLAPNNIPAVCSCVIYISKCRVSKVAKI